MEQIQCYALPYGAIGFSSHVLTYMTVLCLANGRSPLIPCKRLENKTINLLVAIIGLLISFPVTVLTMIRCRNSWPFILIAVWKLVLSVTLSSMAIHASRLIGSFTYTRQPIDDNSYNSQRGWSRGEDRIALLERGTPPGEAGRLEGAAKTAPKNGYSDVLTWLVFYFLGAIVGFVGVMNLVKHNFAGIWQLRTITYAFAGVVGALLLLGCFLACLGRSEGRVGFLEVVGGLVGIVVAGAIFLGVVFAFYADWVLAALAGDWIGRPSSENALFYWTYFAAKRMPMFSF
jgi:hypothetical protein